MSRGRASGRSHSMRQVPGAGGRAWASGRGGSHCCRLPRSPHIPSIFPAVFLACHTCLQYTDPDSGKMYYLHPETKETSWEK